MPEAFLTEVLSLSEINAEQRIVRFVTFDVDDIDAAFEELDARYHTGEAAKHPHTWSVVSGAYASMNRHELFATTPNWVNVDHRRPKIIEEGGLNASLLSMWKLIPDVTFRIEAVHRLSNLGAVCTHVAHGVSQDGFDAEWRGVELLTVEGDLINRCEIFDEADIDTALARFEELHLPARRLENSATQVYERLHSYFVIRDWAAITEILGEGYYQDDGRPVVGGGIRRGRNALMQDLQVAADLGVADATSKAIAIRGERLAVTRVRYSRRDEGPEPFHAEFLQLVEIDADPRIAVLAALDLDDFDAAIAELDARYLAGEAAAHADTWSVIAEATAGFNRQELPATTPDPVYIDHRPLVSIEGVV